MLRNRGFVKGERRSLFTVLMLHPIKNTHTTKTCPWVYFLKMHNVWYIVQWQLGNYINKICCLNIKDRACFCHYLNFLGPNNTSDIKNIIYLFLQGVWDKQSVPVVTDILEKPHYPCEGGAPPTSQPSTAPVWAQPWGPTACFSPRHLTWGKLKKFLWLGRICLGFISAFGDRWRLLLGFLTPAINICLYKHPLSVLLGSFLQFL